MRVRYREHSARSISSTQVRHRQSMAFQGLDDLRDGGLPIGLGVPFRLGKEGAGLLEQVLEPAVGQGILPELG